MRSILMTAIIAAATTTSGSPAIPATDWHDMLPQTMRHACHDEGQNNCYWDATKQGNGHGLSYIVRQFPDGTACVMYVSRKASAYDYCEK